MKRHWSIIGCCLLVVLALLALRPKAPVEPMYQGQPLSQYLGKNGKRWSYSVTTEEAIKAVGPDALPWLMLELGRPEPSWRKKLRGWTDRLSRNRILIGSAQEDRAINAMTGLRMLGSSAAPALPQLARYLAVAESSGTAAWAMAGTGDAAIPYLLKGVPSTDVRIADASVLGLGFLARTSPAATAHLVLLLRSPTQRLRYSAVVALMGVTSRPELTIPALTECTFDQASSVKEVAADALARLRLNPASMIEELNRLMVGTNSVLAFTASNALHVLLADPTSR